MRVLRYQRKFISNFMGHEGRSSRLLQNRIKTSNPSSRFLDLSTRKALYLCRFLYKPVHLKAIFAAISQTKPLYNCYFISTDFKLLVVDHYYVTDLSKTHWTNNKEMNSAIHYIIPYFLIQLPRQLFFFGILGAAIIQGRKLFKGGNY